MPLAKPTERLSADKPADIARAAHLLRTGGTVAFPTETVYGLGANALDTAALEKIFAAKQRPHWDPLIVHIAAREQLPQIATASPTAQCLMDAFWPGPLTLLLPRTMAVPDIVTAGRDLVGVRIPRHPIALELLRQAGVPVAAPSANTFGHTSPTTAQHVLDDLDGRIDAVLDGGPAQVGLESSVVEPTADGVILYRPGAIDLAMLEAIAGAGKVHRYGAADDAHPQSLPSPGVGMRHYAPRARLELVEIPHFRFSGVQDALETAIRAALLDHENVGVMLPDDWLTDSQPFLYPWGEWSKPDVLAQRLFAGLRALDEAQVTLILCPIPTANGIGEALRDRLQKAARQ